MYYVAITGHRPEKIGGYQDNPQTRRIGEVLGKRIVGLKALHPDLVDISGMALGIDNAWACLTRAYELPLLAAVPFVGQELRWPAAAQKLYHELLDYARSTEDRGGGVKIVCEGAYAPWKMQKRNEWMVDISQELIAVWDGSKGGTGNCVAYAQLTGHIINRIDPRQFM